MAGKRIDPSTIDEQAILEIVSSKNDRIGLSVGKCAATVGKEKPRPDFSKDSSQEKAIESSCSVSEKQLVETDTLNFACIILMTCVSSG